MYRISSSLVVALLICLCAVPAGAQDVRLAYLFSDGNLPGMLAAYKALLEERPDLRERVVVIASEFTGRFRLNHTDCFAVATSYR